jgi:tight adherence protein B
MNPSLIPLMTSAAVITAIMALYSFFSDIFLHERTELNARVDFEFLKKQRDKKQKSPLFKNLGKFAAEAIHESNDLTLSKKYELMIEQSGLNLTAARLLAISAGLGLACGLVAFVLKGDWKLSLGALAVGLIIPSFYVDRVGKKRSEALRAQLPDAFDLMARVIRAGQTLPQALQSVADEFPQPISLEFAYCSEQQNLGLSMEATLRDLTRRSGVIELKIFVLAVLIAHETGGNLAELLGKLSGIVRERYKIRGNIRTLTAEGRLQGVILMALPPVMFGILNLCNPTYAGELFNHPEVLLGTFGLVLLGGLCINKIVNFEF